MLLRQRLSTPVVLSAAFLQIPTCPLIHLTPKVSPCEPCCVLLSTNEISLQKESCLSIYDTLFLQFLIATPPPPRSQAGIDTGGVHTAAPLWLLGPVREIECSQQVQLCTILRLYVNTSLAPYSTGILQYMMLQCWCIYAYALKYTGLSQ